MGFSEREREREREREKKLYISYFQKHMIYYEEIITQVREGTM
jgi:hypothetical protein